MTRAKIGLAYFVAAALILTGSQLTAQTYRSDALGDLSHRYYRIIQTSSAGDVIHVIDPTTNTIEGTIDGIGRSHGVTLHADGTRYYISNEIEETVDVVDSRTLQVVKQIPLAANPNNIAGSDLVRKVYVAISGAPMVQVIDMDSDEIVANIPVAGGVHNTFVTPDGKFAVAGMIGATQMAVIDTSTDEVVWTLEFDGGVRPITFETWPDGSTRRAFVQISGFHGIYVVDWQSRSLVEKLPFPTVPVSQLEIDGNQGAPAHGSVVLPDQSAIWVSSRATGSVAAWSLPDLEFKGFLHVGSPDWITASPDSRYIYIGVASENRTVVVDVSTDDVVATIPVGQVPKRIYTAVFPENWNANEEDLDAQ
jgi:YVTN family beta-propeller protein